MALAVALVRGHRAALRGHARELLGGPRARHALRPAAALARRRALLVQQGVIQNFDPYLEVTTLEGAKQTHRDGAGGEPGGHQAARHQRRRLLQRQRGASVREPDAVDQLLVDVHDLRDPVGTDVPARADGRRTSGTAGRVWAAMFVLFFARRDRPPTGPRRAAIRSTRRAASTSSRRRDAIRAATWRARRCASASPTRPSTPR